MLFRSSDAGVPVFCADVKGDLSGISQPGSPSEKLIARATGMGLTLNPKAAPTVFWDLYGQKGHPVRATVSEMGPLLLSRMLDLNDVQEGVLHQQLRRLHSTPFLHLLYPLHQNL